MSSPTPLTTTISIRVSLYYLHLLHPIKGWAGHVATCSPNFMKWCLKQNSTVLLRLKRSGLIGHFRLLKICNISFVLHYVAWWTKKKNNKKSVWMICRFVSARPLILYQENVSKFSLTWYRLVLGRLRFSWGAFRGVKQGCSTLTS